MKRIDVKRGMFIFIVLAGIIFINAAEIYTSDVFGGKKIDFSPDEVVYIYGEGFMENEIVITKIIRPDLSIEIGFSITNKFGEFTYSYELDGITGIYKVISSDKSYVAETIFTDSAIWTTKNDCGDDIQDVNQYDINDSIYINGDGFSA